MQESRTCMCHPTKNVYTYLCVTVIQTTVPPAASPKPSGPGEVLHQLDLLRGADQGYGAAVVGAEEHPHLQDPRSAPADTCRTATRARGAKRLFSGVQQ